MQTAARASWAGAHPRRRPGAETHVLELALLRLGVVDEVGRDVAAVELHALDRLELVVQRAAVLHGDDALLADLVHGARNEAADLDVAVGRDSRDLRDLRAARDLDALRLEVLRHGRDGLHHAAAQVHRVQARGDALAALAEDGARQHRRRRRAVAGLVVRLARHLAHELRAHVVEAVAELDALGHRHAVLGDLRRAEALVQHGVAALGAERHLHGVRELVHAGEHQRARLRVARRGGGRQGGGGGGGR